MSESKSLVKLQRLVLMPDSDMEAAAQQLLQLSDEDNSSNGINKKKKLKSKMRLFEERRRRRSQDEVTSAKIEEIFGKDDEEILRPIKKQRYRFLESIYKETKPIKVSYGNNYLLY